MCNTLVTLFTFSLSTGKSADRGTTKDDLYLTGGPQNSLEKGKHPPVVSNWVHFLNSRAPVGSIGNYCSVANPEYSSSQYCLPFSNDILYILWGWPFNVRSSGEENKNLIEVDYIEEGLTLIFKFLALIYMAGGLNDTHSFEWPFLLKFLCTKIVKQFVFLV